MHPTLAEEKERDRLFEQGFKQCSKCKRILRFSGFWKCASTATGFQSRCKECLGQYRGVHGVEIGVYMAEYRRKNAEKLRGHDAQYGLEHREEKRVYDRQYREEHGGRLRLLRQKWREEHPESISLKNRAYYLAHRERIKAYNRAYKQSAKGKQVHRRGTVRRRARKANVLDTLTSAQWQAVITYFGDTCAYCGMPSGSLEYEHVVPLSGGGEHAATNVIPACKSCNSSKGSLSLAKWLSKATTRFVLANTAKRIKCYFDSLERGLADGG